MNLYMKFMFCLLHLAHVTARPITCGSPFSVCFLQMLQSGMNGFSFSALFLRKFQLISWQNTVWDCYMQLRECHQDGYFGFQLLAAKISRHSWFPKLGDDIPFLFCFWEKVVMILLEIMRIARQMRYNLNHVTNSTTPNQRSTISTRISDQILLSDANLPQQ